MLRELGFRLVSLDASPPTALGGGFAGASQSRSARDVEIAQCAREKTTEVQGVKPEVGWMCANDRCISTDVRGLLSTQRRQPDCDVSQSRKVTAVTCTHACHGEGCMVYANIGRFGLASEALTDQCTWMVMTQCDMRP